MLLHTTSLRCRTLSNYSCQLSASVQHGRISLVLNPQCALGTGHGVLAASELQRQSQATQPELGPDIPELRLRVERFAAGVMRVKLTDAAGERWEVPPHLLGWPASGKCAVHMHMLFLYVFM